MNYWLRWILVLPAAIGTLIGIRTLNNIFVHVYVGLGFGMWAGLLINLFYSFVAPYTFIIAGAKVAPSHRFPASIALAILIAVIIGFLIYYSQLDFVATIIYFISLVSIICACWKIYKESKRKHGNIENQVIYHD